MQTLPLKNRQFPSQKCHQRERLVEIAKALAAHELETLAAQLDYDTIIPLENDWPQLFERLPALGPVMALTRNEWIVHECKGSYAPPSWQNSIGLVQGLNIDLRMFIDRWKYLFAVQVPHAQGVLHGLQIFDDCGCAVHKIYLEPGGNLDAYHALVQTLKLKRWQAETFVHAPGRDTFRTISLDETAALREDWLLLKDEQDFLGLLCKHKVSRLQALQMADPIHVQELGRDAVALLLQKVQAHGEPLMIFAGNSGMIQNFNGPIQNLEKVGDWLKILDPNFNLHINGRGLQHVFAVHKPKPSGTVSSLEVFSSQGDLILSLFGYRKGEGRSSANWDRILQSLRSS